jgi:hypothetical protein
MQATFTENSGVRKVIISSGKSAANMGLQFTIEKFVRQISAL